MFLLDDIVSLIFCSKEAVSISSSVVEKDPKKLQFNIDNETKQAITSASKSFDKYIYICQFLL